MRHRANVRDKGSTQHKIIFVTYENYFKTSRKIYSILDMLDILAF